MIIAKNLSIKFNDMSIVRNLDLKVNEGEIALITGPTGSGKSLLLKTLSGITYLIYPAVKVTGYVRVFGLSPQEAFIKGLTYYIPQDVSLGLMNDSLINELRFYNIKYIPRELIDKLKLSNAVHKPFNNLSVGERYLTLILLALLTRTKALFIDEPSTRLDEDSLRRVLSILQRLASTNGTAILIADHRPSLIKEFTDKTYVISDIKRECDIPSTCFKYFTKSLSKRSLLIINDLWFKYRSSSKWLFRGFNEILNRGSIGVVLGHVGSGKTTLARIVVGYLKPIKGSVRRVKKVFYVPQEPIYWFIHDTVKNEIRSISAIDYKYLLRCIGLGSKSSTSPYALSVGEARALSIYMAYFSDRDLIIIDEPTLGLDSELRECVTHLINLSCNEGKGTLILTHDRDFAFKVKGKVKIIGEQAW